MKRFIFCLSLLTFSSLASAQGAGVGSSGYKNGNSTKGLCTSDNKDESYYAEGVCQSLKEALADDKCTAPLLEKLRKKMLEAQKGTPLKPGDPGFNVGGLVCSSRQYGSNVSDPKFLKNPQAFATVVMQFLMSVAIAESNLDTFNNLQKGPGKLINSGGKVGGLMNLSEDQMNDPKYNKDGCGCKVTNSSQQTAWFWSLFFGEQAFAEGFLAGPSPGPRDAHHSIQCGAYMALVEAEKDGTLFNGMKGGKDGSAPKGAAKIFKSLQEFEKSPTPPNPDDDFSYINNPNLKFVLKKVKTYCSKNLKEDGSLKRTFDDDFPDGGNNLRDNTGIRR